VNETATATVATAAPRGLGSAYWRVWVASTISNLGDGVRFVAMPLLAAHVTRDPRLVSLVTIAGAAPWLLFSLISGALVDRWDRRRIMWIADAFRTAVVGAFTVAVAVGKPSIALIAGVAFLLGTAETMFDNASQTILPAIVGRQQLSTANGRLYSGQIITQQFAGPPLGGLLFGLAIAAPFAVDGASFLAAAVLVLSLTGDFREPKDANATPTRLRHEIGEGVRWLARHRVLRALAGMLGLMNLMSTATESILVLWALEVLHLNSTGFGLLSLGFAGGSLLGSLTAARVAKALGEGRTLYLSVLLMVGSNLGAWATTNAYVAGTAFALAGFAALVWNVITVSLRQEIIPPRLLGRVNSAYRFLGWGSMPIGAAFGGLLAGAFGLRSPFLAAAVAIAVCGVLMARAVNPRSITAARAEHQAAIPA
jgi:MFS family permease